MIRWNRQFTELIRRNRAGYWGNWGLAMHVRPGAVGIVDPATGDFRLVHPSLPGVEIRRDRMPGSWKLLSEHVSRQEGAVDVSAEADDGTGTRGEGGLEVRWAMGRAGAIASEFSLREQAVIADLTRIPAQFRWLAEQAARVGHGRNGAIHQGFGVVTSAIYANSGLNVGSQSENAEFSIAGRASAVREMLGGVAGNGSFSSMRRVRNVDRQVWPARANTRPGEAVPIAYSFASFDGDLFLPNWQRRLGALELEFRNPAGGTFRVQIEVSWQVGNRARTVQRVGVNGGMTRTIGNIPLAARDLRMSARFVGSGSPPIERRWADPLRQWGNGRRRIELRGVWPGRISLRVEEED
ncbi:hypothetical protein K4L06_20020 [Lysobacter sp. BMK333-48F3]|uniref:hypothetical protein n=1 Tax=Lysobacter sp. BMK333-48F3 TaxID=2867962 RepID=UPI001C8CACF3|nr:hypothetical protein [Lysobacter sp. BMK333-48F3]MBX9403602.1 hypothetical protein [Lysobacter sp. BMK333-48F3]